MDSCRRRKAIFVGACGNIIHFQGHCSELALLVEKRSAIPVARTFSKRRGLALFTGASGTKPRRLDAQTACEAYARSGGRAGRPCARTKIVNVPGSTVPPLVVLDPSLARVWRAGSHALVRSSGLD